MGIDAENTRRLKPCPICGEKDELALWSDKDRKFNGLKLPWASVVCSRCNIETWGNYKTEDAIKHWNKLPRRDR